MARLFPVPKIFVIYVTVIDYVIWLTENGGFTPNKSQGKIRTTFYYI